jgi:ketopantoate reductase
VILTAGGSDHAWIEEGLMRVAVLGAGAIGAYVGAALHRGGTEVHLIARGAHLEEIRSNGVKVLSPRGDFAARTPEETRFSIGEPAGGRSERCETFSAAMIAGGLKCPVEADIRTDIWIKLLGNAAFNPISALARATMVEIATHQGTRAMVRLMMEESLEIAAAVGCHPDISVDKRINGAERVGEHKTSMLQDLKKDKPLELDVILAAVVELADLTGTKAPTLRAVHAVADLLATKVGASPATTGRAVQPPRVPEPGGSGHSDVGPTCSTYNSSGPSDGPATNCATGSAITSSSSTTSSLRPDRSTGPGT